MCGKTHFRRSSGQDQHERARKLGACDALAMNPDDVYDMTLVRESLSYVKHLLAWGVHVTAHDNGH